MANSVGGLKVFMKAVVNAKPWLKDPLAVRKKWNEDEYNLVDHGYGKNLCFGIMWDDGVIVPHPPIKRALEMTKMALEKAGHKGVFRLTSPLNCAHLVVVVDWQPLKHRSLANATVRSRVLPTSACLT